MISGIILAAGLSERMGGDVPTQLRTIDGVPMVAIAAAGAVKSLLDEVVVVTGHEADAVAEAVAATGARVAVNPSYMEGNMTSLRVGAQALAGSDAYVLLLADMPGVTTRIIDEMVKVWREDRPWAAVAVYRDGIRHPVLLSADAMDRVVPCSGPKAVWRMLEDADPAAVHQVPFDMDAPMDVNTPADYETISREAPGLD